MQAGWRRIVRECNPGRFKRIRTFATLLFGPFMAPAAAPYHYLASLLPTAVGADAGAREGDEAAKCFGLLRP